MSFAKDDIGLTNVSSLVQAGTLKTRIVNESSEVEKTVSDDPGSSEKLTFSDNLDKILSGIKDSLDQNQEGGTVLDIVSNSYDSISGTMSEIEKQVQYAIKNKASDADFKKLSESIKSKLEDIEKTVNNTTFNGKELLDGSLKNNNDTSSEFDDASLSALGLPEAKDFEIKNKEDAEELSKKLEKAKEEIAKRQSKVNDSQKEIQNSMQDLFLTKINLLEEDESKNNSVEQTKDNIISGILDNPSKSVQVHIKTIDPDVLIALIRLRTAT